MQVSAALGQALARDTDPDTSHAAAVDAQGLCEIIYKVIAGYKDGCISDDVEAALPHILSHSLTPRYRQMIDAGMLEVTGEKRKGDSGHHQQVRRVLPPPFQPPAKRSLATRKELVNVLEEMVNVFAMYRIMSVQEMETIDAANKILRRT
jgi:hypothetical protein